MACVVLQYLCTVSVSVHSGQGCDDVCVCTAAVGVSCSAAGVHSSGGHRGRVYMLPHSHAMWHGCCGTDSDSECHSSPSGVSFIASALVGLSGIESHEPLILSSGRHLSDAGCCLGILVTCCVLHGPGVERICPESHSAEPLSLAHG